MELETVSILNGLTVKVGTSKDSYEFAKVDFGLTARFVTGDDIAECIEQVSELTKIYLKAELRKIAIITGNIVENPEVPSEEQPAEE